MTIHNPSHPGIHIHQVHMVPQNMSNRVLAARLGVGASTVGRLVSGKSAITPAMAMRLSRAFNTTPQLWLNMQQGYDLWQLDRPKNRRLFAKIKPIEHESPEAICA